MSADDEKAAPDIPPLPVELEVPVAPVSGEVAGEELPPLPDEMEGKASPVGGKASGEELPPLPPGMTRDDTAVRPTPVLRPQPAEGSAEPQNVPYSQAQKPKGKGAMVALILALVACALYQGAQAWQAKQSETEAKQSGAEAKEKAQQNAAAEAKATQQAKEIQAHADRIVGLAKLKHEADGALKSVQDERDNFEAESRDVDVQRSRRREEAERALREAEERKRELKGKLKGVRS